MTRWVLLLMLVGACPSKPSATTGGGGSQGSGGGTPVVTHPTGCADLKTKVEQLYRAEAQAKEPKRVEAAVADNTAMVMNDCAKDPATAVPCLAKAQSVSEIEKQCLVPLDEEGTEGEPK